MNPVAALQMPAVAMLLARLEEFWVNALDDSALVVAIAGGDNQAFGELYDRYSSTMLGIAERLLKTARDAEDLLHDVFLEVFRQAHTYDPKRGTVRAWLLRRLRSRAFDKLRSVSVSRVDVDSDGLEMMVHPASTTAISDGPRVQKAVGELPDDQRQVLELGYFEGLTLVEVATMLDLPVGTVKSRLSRALAQLRERFKDGEWQ